MQWEGKKQIQLSYSNFYVLVKQKPFPLRWLLLPVPRRVDLLMEICKLKLCKNARKTFFLIESRVLRTFPLDLFTFPFTRERPERSLVNILCLHARYNSSIESNRFIPCCNLLSNLPTQLEFNWHGWWKVMAWKAGCPVRTCRQQELKAALKNQRNSKSEAKVN